MPKQVIVLSGVSGSGKTRLANKMAKSISGYEPDGLIVSADDYFTDSLGEYRFNPSKLGEAHAECFRSFLAGLQNGRELIIVDNTNTTKREIAPYMLGASAFGYSSRIHAIVCPNTHIDTTDLRACAEHNTHKVPLSAIFAQNDRQRKMLTDVPPYWQVQVQVYSSAR